MGFQSLDRLTDGHPENRARLGPRGGRPRTFDKDAYKGRNVVERFFNRLKLWRGIATRSDKTARSYLAGVTFADSLVGEVVQATP